MITEATARASKLWPERLPNTGFVNIPPGPMTPAQLGIQQFNKAGVWARFGGLIQPAPPLVTMRITSDEVVNHIPLAAVRAGVYETYDLESIRYLDFMYSAAAPGVLGHTWYHDCWFYSPTVAHKLARRQPLTAEEAALAEELGLRETVEKGLLPMPLDYQVMREYRVIQEVTRTRNSGLAAGVETILDTIHVMAPNDEAVILTGFSCTPDFAALDTVLTFDRDKDMGFVSSLWTTPLVFANNYPVYIPALQQLTLKARSTAGIGAGLFSIRYTYRRVKLSNILRARWAATLGLGPTDFPGDVWKKVRGGVL